MPATATLPELLHRVFGHRDFRPHQQEVCEAAAAGRDVLLVMPTGAGKSLCYQLPALARSDPRNGGTALVISPLIALMDDQASKLEALGLRVARIHSGLPRESARQACRDYLDGALDFLFIAPERMRVPGFPEMLAKRKPTLVAIDEAHCISQWGHDFRPDYRTLGQYLPQLRPASIIALTATATPAVQRDILAQLQVRDPAVFITGFRRSNLAVEVVELSKPKRADFALQLLKDDGARPAIIYAGSRKDAEELAGKLHKHFPTAAYHAGLDAQTRERVQSAFQSSKLDVVVATVAFGMGIDKADVRTVIHVALPGSVEAFYQEIGRAGRDGQPARTVLLHGFADRRLQEFLLERNYPPASELERVAAILPADFAAVNDLHNALLKKRVTMDRDTLDRSIEKLLAAGIALMNFNGDVKRAEDMSAAADPTAATAPTAAAPWQRNYNDQIAARRTQIDRMIAFAESTTCRMAALIAHFGDSTDLRRDCGLCDICNPSGSSASPAHQPNSEERRQLRSILRALEGRGTSTGKLFTDLKLTKHRDDFDVLLEALARAGLIHLNNDTFTTSEGKDITYKKATIAPEGRDPDDRALDTVWLRTGNEDASAGPRKKSKAKSSETRDRIPLNPRAEELFETLRDWRTETARPTKTPAFMILSDAVMRAIAAANPQTLSALGAVPGIGPSKVEKYGAALVAVCRGQAHDTAPNPAPAAKAARSTGSRPHSPGTAQTPAAAPSPGPARPRAPTAARAADAMKERSSEPLLELSADQLALDGRLRDWRRSAAAAAGLPSFFILSDTALRAITLAEPSSLDQLRRVRGLDLEKVERFAPAILECCTMQPAP
jgi:ATP-dependent DNA helicase RecQ